MSKRMSHRRMTGGEYHCATAPPRAVALWRASAKVVPPAKATATRGWRSAV